MLAVFVILMSFSRGSRTKERNKAIAPFAITRTVILERIRDKYCLLTFVYSPVIDGGVLLSCRQEVSNVVGYRGARGR